MASASLAAWPLYHGEPFGERESQVHRGYSSRRSRIWDANDLVADRRYVSSGYSGVERYRMKVQARRAAAEASLTLGAEASATAATEASGTKAERPSIDLRTQILIDGAVPVSFSIVVIALFVFLLELSAGRLAFLMPSFSAMFIFLMIALVTLRLRRTVGSIENDRPPR